MYKNLFCLVPITVVLALAANVWAADRHSDASMPSDYGKVLAQHDIIFDSPGVPHNRQPGANLIDGPLMGNGDIGAVAHGHPEVMIINVGKNHVWDRFDFTFPREEGIIHRSER